MEGNLNPIPRTFICPSQETSNSRNLVVCIDGTSNRFGIKNTNIIELCSHITKNNRQLTFYSSGLGAITKATGGSVLHRLSSALDMAFGWNLHKAIVASYCWLSDNYQVGDRIFLFGFSRGAYQVRALAGMIARVGLLFPGNHEQIPLAFDFYSKVGDNDMTLINPSTIKQGVEKETEKAEYAILAKAFKKAFCRSNIHIHFVGVWDTVSSVGISRSKTLPCTTTSSEHICYFRHALALDEQRVKFLPEYVYGGRSGSSDDGRIKEVWFPGCHSDVGGGNRRNEKLQSGSIPLLWMRSQATSAGLEMEPADMMWRIDDLDKQIKPSLSKLWWPLELLPLKRLLYCNSDGNTSRPHLGEPRRILPGQKVHVSVLFRSNYKPRAKFHNNSVGWPEPMFWNDATSHQRLQNLPDLWEKDNVDDGSLLTLLNDLKRDQSVLDALDRLTFLANFDVYKNAINEHKDASPILSTFLKSTNKGVRLRTAVTYCELEWDWPLEMTKGDLGQQIIEDISELLTSSDEKECRRACISMPSLCKRSELKAGLLSDINLRKLVQLCDSACIHKYEEGTSTVAFHSAQALSMLMKLDDQFAAKLIDIDLVTDIAEALRSDCRPVLVAVLNVVDGLAKHESGRMTMKSGPIIATLVKLLKHFDDFVAPAATRVLCSLLPDKELRETMLQFGVFSTLLDMLDRCSEETKQVACQALIEFVRHSDIRDGIIQYGYIEKLAKQAHIPSKRDGTIIALVTLGKTQVSAAVTEAMKSAGTIPVLVNQLKQKSTALSTALALAHLAGIDGVAEVVSKDESGAGAAIVHMLQSRRFEALREDSLQVLSKLLECERLRSAVLKAGAIDLLRRMIESGKHESTFAGLQYLLAFTRSDKDKSALPSDEKQTLVRSVVGALRAPQRRVQRIAIDTLRCLSTKEDLRTKIVDGLLDLLGEQQANVVLAASTALSFLAVDRSVRDRVLSREVFWRLSERYYEGLNLEYDDRENGARRGEVYESVGQLIRLMQMHGSDEEGQSNEGSERGVELCSGRVLSGDNAF